MKYFNLFRNSLIFSSLSHLFRWGVLVLPIAITIGSVVALFLWLLNVVIHFRFGHNWLLFLLPAAGLLIHFIYQSVGKSSEKGNNLIMEEIYKTGAGVPWHMAPVILITTLVTHLFGGSAGREGTAVQIGGSIAAMFSRWFKLDEDDTKMVLTAGIAAGFGAVFGTPLTGAIFALEVLTLERIKYNALVPALVASIIGDLTVSAWHIHHTAYHITAVPSDVLLLVKIVSASIVFGLASYLFSFLVHAIKNIFSRLFSVKWMIPVTGGIIIIAITWFLSKPDYLSLGIDAEYPGAVTLPSAFIEGGAGVFSWLWKTIYTVVTLGTGFKGGEVTPLFYIGATLGNTLSQLFNAPVSLFAALGFIAVFAGATNTPLACTIMGMELFGGEYALFFAIACFTAYFFSGHAGIYSAQMIDTPKTANNDFAALPVADSARSQALIYLHRKLSRYKIRLTYRKKNR